jgi:hypothetical protein
MTEDRAQGAKDDGRSDEDDLIDEEVDVALEETFPASDPPPWTLGTDHSVETKGRQDNPESRDEDAGE